MSSIARHNTNTSETALRAVELGMRKKKTSVLFNSKEMRLNHTMYIELPEYLSLLISTYTHLLSRNPEYAPKNGKTHEYSRVSFNFARGCPFDSNI
jgi:hypothetical protein